jgi:hypothetical protein
VKKKVLANLKSESLEIIPQDLKKKYIHINPCNLKENSKTKSHSNPVIWILHGQDIYEANEIKIMGDSELVYKRNSEDHLTQDS